MTDYLLDTLLWTGALIALVLLVRRPVARHFGAKAAYALWLLPMVRLVMPPITLPAMFAPTQDAVFLPPVAAAEVSISHANTFDPQALAAAPVVSEAPPFTVDVDFVTPLVILWLAGAVIFLVRRFYLYAVMRRDMLAEARPMGEAGPIRLVETPATTGPVAFGVRDRVIALPPGFLAQSDRRMRDLALAHELAHHRGRDLLVNFCVQPLFALHWFNPLGWAGWRALRRDQEAACDARVVERMQRRERADYAEVIARFAAGPHAALAAPMACPVLGDKSIIQRLRSLSMSDPTPRKKATAKFLLTGAALALPLTASISYAKADADRDVTLPPAAPEAPDAPLPPAPPLPPEAPDAPEFWDAGYEEGEAAFERAMLEGERAEAEAEREWQRAEREWERAERQQELAEERMEQAEEISDARQEARRVSMVHGKRVVHGDLDSAEMREALREARIELRMADEELKRHAIDRRELERNIETALSALDETTRIVSVECPRGTNYTQTNTVNGKTTVRICATKIAAEALSHARNGMIEARKAIAADRHMDREDKREALRSLDREIAKLQREI